jgi:RNA polymerase sigma-70 factor (ECF subfamily)
VSSASRYPSVSILAFAAGGRDAALPSPEAVGRTISDAQIVALARVQPADALDVLYSAHKVRIYSFLLRFLGDPEAADDLTHDTFAKAYAAIGGLTPEHRVLPWLYRIAHNTAIDHVRRTRRVSWLRLGGLVKTREEPHSPDEHGRVPERELVRSTLRRLPPENAAALLLHALEGYSYREIAEIQGCSMTAVRSRIARARAAFREHYATNAPE